MALTHCTVAVLTVAVLTMTVRAMAILHGYTNDDTALNLVV